MPTTTALLDLEAAAAARFPAWFAGRRATATRAFVRGLARFVRLDEASATVSRHAHLAGLELVEALLVDLEAGYFVDPIERQRIPERGRVVIVANHPLGAIDALALLHCVGQVRRDVRIVANDVLAAIGGLAPLLLPVRNLGGGASRDSVRAIEAALADDEAVIVFPAGVVARAGWRGIRDGRWQRGFARFAAQSGAPVLPVHVRGRNSAFFYCAAAFAGPFGAALLPREALARRGVRVTLRVAPLRPAPDAGTRRDVVAEVRADVESIGRGRDRRDATPPVAHASARVDVARELAALPCLGTLGGSRRVHAGRLAPGSALLAEIGRLREATFRAVGEGSGQARDLDRFDAWYDHIVLWDADACEVLGAYRVAPCARVITERGEDGLNTRSLFDYDATLRQQLPHALELGRSFVQPAYWGSRSLDLLWCGIGAYLRTQPGVRWLFGPVSISGALPPAARDQLVAYYDAYHGARGRQVLARRPYLPHREATPFGALDADAAMRVMRANLAALGAEVPVLYRHYVELCEPGGVQFLAFGVDPAFSGCVDGLVQVDLDRLRPRKRARYVEGAAAAALPA